jgi:hypothetical protein
VEQAEAVYLALGNTGDLYAIPLSSGVGTVDADEMKRVYKGTFVRSKGTRDIYDQLKKLTPNDICPTCGQRTVATLDHYLAQSLHSLLTITPANLLPCCIDCNKAKLDVQPACRIEQTLHPYFDNIDDHHWLKAEVKEVAPAALLFYASPPALLGADMCARVHRHFATFGLASLYASHSAAELVNIRYGLMRIAERGTPDDVRGELSRRADSYRAAFQNSWQTAMYTALASSDWFCEGGFT